MGCCGGGSCRSALSDEVRVAFGGSTCRNERKNAFRQDVLDLAPLVVQLVLDHLGDPTKTGGCMTVMQAERTAETVVTGELVLVVESGKKERYAELSIEKAVRLLRMHREKGHLSSFQSADESREKYPGAILAYDPSGRRYIFSFSALPAIYDEAAMLLLARAFGMQKKKLLEIAWMSKNQVYLDLIHKLDAMVKKWAAEKK